MEGDNRCGQREGKGSRCIGGLCLSVCLVRMNRGSRKSGSVVNKLTSHLASPGSPHIVTASSITSSHFKEPFKRKHMSFLTLLTSHWYFLLTSPHLSLVFSPHLSPIFMSHSLLIPSYFISCYDATLASPHAF
ncbi:hypothetical protein Pmani_025732 [Petrolisthes manimaculis]|uniref:Uncharacterized protein n=1 Tax=Petrolisthes manimaculis TaxID=1843537 RepID=A0AAE1P4Y4_9EUCA|nr:hypothetical protein Pmani_025732 [Petrolisthes manimaculis]